MSGPFSGEVVDFDREKGVLVIHSEEEGLVTLRSMTDSGELFDALEEMKRGWPTTDG